MYFANPGVQEKFGLGPLRFALSDEVGGTVQTKSAHSYSGQIPFDSLIFGIDVDDAVSEESGGDGTYTTSSGDIEFAINREPSGDDTGLTYSWSMSTAGFKSSGGSVAITTGSTTNQKFEPTLQFTVNSESGGFVRQDMSIFCTVTETKGAGRTSSQSYGVVFRTRVLFE
jgi:hypothetical protein